MAFWLPSSRGCCWVGRLARFSWHDKSSGLRYSAVARIIHLRLIVLGSQVSSSHRATTDRQLKHGSLKPTAIGAYGTDSLLEGAGSIRLWLLGEWRQDNSGLTMRRGHDPAPVGLRGPRNLSCRVVGLATTAPRLTGNGKAAPPQASRLSLAQVVVAVRPRRRQVMCVRIRAPVAG